MKPTFARHSLGWMTRVGAGIARHCRYATPRTRGLNRWTWPPEAMHDPDHPHEGVHCECATIHVRGCGANGRAFDVEAFAICGVFVRLLESGRERGRRPARVLCCSCRRPDLHL